VVTPRNVGQFHVKHLLPPSLAGPLPPRPRRCSGWVRRSVGCGPSSRASNAHRIRWAVSRDLQPQRGCSPGFTPKMPRRPAADRWADPAQVAAGGWRASRGPAEPPDSRQGGEGSGFDVPASTRHPGSTGTSWTRASSVRPSAPVGQRGPLLSAANCYGPYHAATWQPRRRHPALRRPGAGTRRIFPGVRASDRSEPDCGDVHRAAHHRLVCPAACGGGGSGVGHRCARPADSRYRGCLRSVGLE
jgi:hypothetical protein